MLARLAALTCCLAAATAPAQQPCAPCGDLAPRVGGDGRLTVGDVVVELRFAAGLEAPTSEELRRADVAPAEPLEALTQAGLLPERLRVLGDGSLSVADVVVLLRLAVGLSSVELPPPPEILGVAPERSCWAWGTLLTIRGRHLLPGFSMPEVAFDGLPAARGGAGGLPGDLFADGLDRVTVLIPQPEPEPSEPTWRTLSVRTVAGEASLADAVLVQDPCSEEPSITGISPQSGSNASTLTVSGTGLECAVVEAFHPWAREWVRLPISLHLDDGSPVVSAPLRGTPFGLPSDDEWPIRVLSPCGESESAQPWTQVEAAAGPPPSCGDEEPWTLELGIGRPRILRAAAGESFAAVDGVWWWEASLGGYQPEPVLFRTDEALAVRPSALPLELFSRGEPAENCGQAPRFFERPDALGFSDGAEKTLGDDFASFTLWGADLAWVERILVGEQVLLVNRDFEPAGLASISRIRMPDPEPWPSEDLTVDVVVETEDGWKDLSPVPFTFRLP